MAVTTTSLQRRERNNHDVGVLMLAQACLSSVVEPEGLRAARTPAPVAHWPERTGQSAQGRGVRVRTAAGPAATPPGGHAGDVLFVPAIKRTSCGPLASPLSR